MQALNLDDNYLQSLPPSLERLTELTELSVTNLQLQSLPFVLGAMTGLTDLRLTASRTMSNPPYEIVVQGTEVLLGFIRKAYACVRRTGYMNISGMALEELPMEVMELGNLRHLQVSAPPPFPRIQRMLRVFACGACRMQHAECSLQNAACNAECSADVLVHGTRVQARDNHIIHLSSAVAKMNCVERLHLHRNGPPPPPPPSLPY